MSLKCEQRFDNFFFTECEPKIYTTGVHLVPMEIKKGNKRRYVWVVYEFDDDSYLDGKFCSPTLYADSLKNMIEN